MKFGFFIAVRIIYLTKHTRMLHSMTGFGSAEKTHKDKHIRVDIRSLNGKSTDIRIKVPNLYRAKELDIRNSVLNSLQRGKIDLTISFESSQGEENYNINTQLVKQYCKELQSVSSDLNLDQADILQSVMRIPNIVSVKSDTISNEEWDITKELIAVACAQLNAHRASEGKTLEDDLELHVNAIKAALKEVPKYESDRITRLRERLQQRIANELESTELDKNRFEQEIFYYIEKLDISEEQNRLSHHCKYFLEILNKADKLCGRQLAFVSQEMGREINTLGAKAQDKSLQKVVVQMKDNLEKIKEQIANVL